jgi:hypothetical protein
MGERGVCGPPRVEEAANAKKASSTRTTESGAPVSPALALLEGWFTEEERGHCPFCDAHEAIGHGSLLVCLGCAAVSIGGSRPLGWSQDAS